MVSIKVFFCEKSTKAQTKKHACDIGVHERKLTFALTIVMTRSGIWCPQLNVLSPEFSPTEIFHFPITCSKTSKPIMENAREEVTDVLLLEKKTIDKAFK